MKENRTALYLRLSRDDRKTLDSESIVNQREFLIDYANKNSLNVVKIFSDDGYTGTDFVRPAFNEMLEFIEAGKINTVVTKDLSRLGRDYIQTGYFIEQYFPMRGVRYIAVNDNIDTVYNGSGNEMTPFRAVFNDMYAKDISKKVRTALDTKKANGKFIGSSAPFGYKKDPNDKNHLIIDEEAAVYVRMIFRDFLSGTGIIGIAHKLTQNEIPTPSEYKNQNLNKENVKKVWNDTSVRRILSNPTYAGNLTQNKSIKINYKVKRKVRLPETEWITVHGTHEGIISEEEFKMAEELLKKRSYNKKRRTGGRHVLSGMVFCNECKGAMSYISESEKRVYMVCSRWRKNAKLGICTSHCIRESYVEDVVREKLRELTSKADLPKILAEAYAFLKNSRSGESLAEPLKRKIEICKNTSLNLYKDKAEGRIGEDDYNELSKMLKKERSGYEKRLEAICSEENKNIKLNDMQEILNAVLRFENLERNILIMLIDKIYIGKNKEIEILFKFDNPYNEKEHS